MKFRISLKLKIVFAFVLLVILMMAAVTYIFTIRELSLRVAQVTLRMERLANNIASIRSVESEDWDVYQTYIDNQLKLNPDIIYISIVDEIGELKAFTLNIDWIEWTSDRRPTRFEQADIIRQLEHRQIALESQRDFESKSVNILVGERNLGTVNVGFSLVELNDEMRSNLLRNFELGLFFMAVAIVIAFLFSIKIVCPLGKFTSAMQKVAEGDFGQEIQVESGDELGEMAHTFNSMTRGLREKEFIENFGRELAFTIEIKKITGLITSQITRAMNAERGILFLRDKARAHEFKPVHLEPLQNVAPPKLECKPELCQFFLKTAAPQDLGTFAAFPDFYNSVRVKPDQANQVIISPIIVKDQVVGIFVLFFQKDEFLDSKKNFLSTLIGQGGFAIENALLLEELTQQERMQRELEIARQVQQSLLPQQQLQIAGLELDGICLPATEVGGDYYDFFVIDEQTVGIAIADVAGKGISAAFYMALVKGSMLALTHHHLAPRPLLIELNRQLYGKMDRKVFITMLYVTIDLKQKRMQIARAGHNSLLVKSDKNRGVQRMTPKGIGIGLDAGPVFEKMIEEKTLALDSGDQFLFYTDGISESMNNQREEFGEERLLSLLRNTQETQPAAIRRQIIQEIEIFVKDVPQHDDMTMINLRIV